MRQQAREKEREARAETAALKAAERDRKAAETAAGKARAQDLNDEIEDQTIALETILAHGLERSPRFDPQVLLRRDELPVLDLGPRGRPAPAPVWTDPAAPGAFARLFGGRARHEDRVARARQEFQRAVQEHENQERVRQRWVEQERARHSQEAHAHREERDQHNARITAFAVGVLERDRPSVQNYLEMVLNRTRLPDSVPHQVEVAYSPQGEQAVVRFELPPVDVVPTAAAYTYVASSAATKERSRTAAQIAQLYRSVVSQIALLYMRDLFEADPELVNVELSGHVHAVSPATGQREYPCLISFGVDRETYEGLNLHDVTPRECLTYLNALVSHHPHLVEAVTPVRDFDLARFAFTKSVDVVAEMDSRTDLTAITPTEFEHFVRQLLEARGLKGWTTDRTGDDGVDAVVLNTDPIIGGLTIVQAKKYTRVLGVNHIRELVGAMDEKRAGRAVLITTSWFSSGCWTKAAENGRVELIDGSGLRALAQEHLGMDVLVAPPTQRGRGVRRAKR